MATQAALGRLANHVLQTPPCCRLCQAPPCIQTMPGTDVIQLLRHRQIEQQLFLAVGRAVREILLELDVDFCVDIIDERSIIFFGRFVFGAKCGRRRRSTPATAKRAKDQRRGESRFPANRCLIFDPLTEFRMDVAWHRCQCVSGTRPVVQNNAPQRATGEKKLSRRILCGWPSDV